MHRRLRGLDDLSVTLGTDRTVIRLFDLFDDVEDADEDLTFSVVEDTHSGLFSSIRLNAESGLLVLDHEPGATGAADLTVMATDTGGLSVGLAARQGFTVYDSIGGTIGINSPDTESLGLSPISLWTHWFFFDRVDGQYQYDHLDVEHFRTLLHDPRFSDPEVPVVFDIENDYFTNTPEGRDRFAEVLAIANEERPDLEIGIYRFLPERSWHVPVSWETMNEHQELGIASWYTQNRETFTERHDAWLARNELYRTVDVDDQLGGQPLAEMVDAIHASLYTFYRNVDSEPIWHAATVDGRANTITVEGQTLEDVQQVRLTMATDAQLPSGLSRYVEYYVVNATGSTFQLAATSDGQPVDFGENASGRIYVGDIGPWEDPLDDPNVVRWRSYAEQNLAEAHQYGKPVYAWISPSVKGIGAVHLEQDFFRLQLEILKPLVDGIVIYEPPTHSAAYHESQGWWGALEDFLDQFEEPETTFTVRVTEAEPKNVAPIARDDTLMGQEDLPLTIEFDELLANDFDPDQDPLNLRVLQQPSHGTLQAIDLGILRYTPDPGYAGNDSFTYRVNDGQLGSDPATVSLRILPDADRPLAAREEYTTPEDERLILHRSDLIADGFDSADELRIQLVDDPAHGAVRLTASGALVYSPQRNFHGVDQFGYRMIDADGSSQLVAVQVRVTPENDQPISRADVFRTVSGSPLRIGGEGVLRNDFDLDGDSLRARLLAGPRHGSLVFHPDGTFVYQPDPAYHGLDRFRYLTVDEHGERTVGEVRVRVNPLADSTSGWATARAGGIPAWMALLRRWIQAR